MALQFIQMLLTSDNNSIVITFHCLGDEKGLHTALFLLSDWQMSQPAPLVALMLWLDLVIC
jgi:hypothetical protein